MLLFPVHPFLPNFLFRFSSSQAIKRKFFKCKLLVEIPPRVIEAVRDGLCKLKIASELTIKWKFSFAWNIRIELRRSMLWKISEFHTRTEKWLLSGFTRVWQYTYISISWSYLTWGLRSAESCYILATTIYCIPCLIEPPAQRKLNEVHLMTKRGPHLEDNKELSNQSEFQSEFSFNLHSFRWVFGSFVLKPTSPANRLEINEWRKREVNTRS